MCTQLHTCMYREGISKRIWRTFWKSVRLGKNPGAFKDSKDRETTQKSGPGRSRSKVTQHLGHQVGQYDQYSQRVTGGH